MKQTVKEIATATMPTIPPFSARCLEEALQVKIGLASQIHAPGNPAPRLMSEIVLSPVAGVE